MVNHALYWSDYMNRKENQENSNCQPPDLTNLDERVLSQMRLIAGRDKKGLQFFKAVREGAKQTELTASFSNSSYVSKRLSDYEEEQILEEIGDGYKPTIFGEYLYSLQEKWSNAANLAPFTKSSHHLRRGLCLPRISKISSTRKSYKGIRKHGRHIKTESVHQPKYER